MKKIILLISILALTLGLFAAEVVIGTGTSTQRHPFGSYWSYERSAALYTAADIGPQNTRISAVSWYSSIATTAAVPTKIYLKATTANTLDIDTWTNMISGATLLYDQDLTGLIGGGWNLFTLDDTFDLDLGDNLMILVEMNTGGYGGAPGGGGYQGGGIHSTSSTGTHLFWYGDWTHEIVNGTLANMTPNVTLTYTTYVYDTPPSPAIVNSPADTAIDVGPHATLNWDTGGGGPTGYRLFLGTDNPPTNIEEDTDLGNVITYDPSGLEYSTTYYWKVIPYNSFGDASGNLVWRFTTMADPGINSFPWTVGFEEEWTGTPAAPLGWSQINVSGEAAWNRNQFEHHTGSYSARGQAAWIVGGESLLITPALNLGTRGYRLKFWLKGSYRPGTDLKVQIASSSSSAASFDTDLRHYVVGTNMPTVWTEQIINLDAYEGIQHIAFRLIDASGQSLNIDDVRIEEMPTEPLFIYTPTSIDFGSASVDTPTAYQNVTVTNLGGGTLSLTAANISLTGTAADQFEFDTTAGFPANLGADEEVNLPVRFAPSSAGVKSATLIISCSGTDYEIALNGNAVSGNILLEGFEGGVIPDNWTVINADGSNSWVASTINPRTGNYCAYIESDYGNDDWLITPALQVTTGTTDNISFWMMNGESPDDNEYQILISTTDTNPASFTEIDYDYYVGSTYIQKSYNLDSYGDAIIYLAIRYGDYTDSYLCVDDFVGPPIYAPEGLAQPEITISTSGTSVVLDWDLIPNASTYQIHASDTPDGEYTLLATVTGNTYSTSATSKKFFKVIASTENE